MLKTVAIISIGYSKPSSSVMDILNSINYGYNYCQISTGSIERFIGGYRPKKTRRKETKVSCDKSFYQIGIHLSH